MKWIRLIHRWFGLILSLFVILIALTGGTLVFKENILRATWPVLSKSISPEQEENYTQVISKIEARFQKPSVEFIRFPRDGMNVFHVWLSDESQVFVDPISGEVIRQWKLFESIVSLMTDGVFLLHSHLLAGEVGEIVVGCIGLFILFFVFSGLILWWPQRSRFKFKDAIPKKTTTIHFLRSHKTIGVISSGFILLFVITGVTMVFYRPVALVVTTLIDPQPPMLADAKVMVKDQEFKSWDEIMAVLDNTLSGGIIQSYSPPNGENAIMTFRKRMPEEWHPFGRSFILLDPYTANVIQIIDARKQHSGMRLMEKIYPLHASKVGGLPLMMTAVITAILLMVLSGFGLMGYIARFKQ